MRAVNRIAKQALTTMDGLLRHVIHLYSEFGTFLDRVHRLWPQTMSDVAAIHELFDRRYICMTNIQRARYPPNAQNPANGTTLLMKVVHSALTWCNQICGVKTNEVVWLLEHGADPLIRDATGRTVKDRIACFLARHGKDNRHIQTRCSYMTLLLESTPEEQEQCRCFEYMHPPVQRTPLIELLIKLWDKEPDSGTETTTHQHIGMDDV